MSMTRTNPWVVQGRTNTGEVDCAVAWIASGVYAAELAWAPVALACVQVAQHGERVHAAEAERETNDDCRGYRSQHATTH